MMKKKILLAALTSAFSVTLFAQSMAVTGTRTTFGLRGGVNFQNINGKTANGSNLENTLRTGYHAGLNAEIPVGTGSYVQPGVLYSVKGAKIQGTENKIKLSYIEVPVNFVYKPVLGTGNMVLGFGPYVGFAIGGQVEAENGTERKVQFTNRYNTSSTSPQFRKFDAGGNLLAGYEFANKVSFQLNAQLGLVDINPEPANSNDQTRQRNTGWGLSLGYRF